MLFQRIVGVFVMSLGALGVAACVAGAYPVWLTGSRLTRANEKIFTLLDDGLATTQDQTLNVQSRLRESRITASELAHGVRDWSIRQAEERLVTQLEVERRVAELAAHLQTADSWCEKSAEAIRVLRELLEVGQLAGGRVDPTSLDDILEKLDLLRNSLQETERAVAGVRSFAAGNEDSVESQLARATRLLAIVLTTLTDIDGRLDDVVKRLSKLRTEATELKGQTRNYLLLATLACYVMLAWIGVGQIALCRWGWTGCRRLPAAN